MVYSLRSRIVFFWVALFLIFGFIKSASAAIPTPVAPHQKIEFQGRSYEILKDPGLNVVTLTTDLRVGPVRDELILKIKRGSLPPRHIHLRLSSTTPQSMIYTGILPAKIQWQGNLRFEIVGARGAR